MTHDPLCPRLSNDSPQRICEVCYEYACECCQCDLIARVRANEKAKWTHTCPDNNCCHQPGD